MSNKSQSQLKKQQNKDKKVPAKRAKKNSNGILNQITQIEATGNQSSKSNDK